MNQQAAQWLLDYCYEYAASSLCQKRQFGAVIVPKWVLDSRWNSSTDLHKEILARGANQSYDWAPCEPCLRVDVPSGTKQELCRAVHAEQVALIDLLTSYPSYPLNLSIAVNGREGSKRIYKGKPGFYCTTCARLLAWVGIMSVVVLTKDGPAELTMQEALDSAYGVAKGADADTHTFHEMYQGPGSSSR